MAHSAEIQSPIVQWRPLVLITSILLATAGCGEYDAAVHRVDPMLARQTLQQVLSSWQEGGSPQSWQEKEPAVVVQDPDWSNGRTLVAYEMLDNGKAVDANLYCQVRLVLDDNRKGKFERKITYMIGTSPVITVFRAPDL